MPKPIENKSLQAARGKLMSSTDPARSYSKAAGITLPPSLPPALP